MVGWKLGRSGDVLVAHPDYLARHGAPAHPDELRLHAALVYSLSPTARRLVQVLAEWRLPAQRIHALIRMRAPLPRKTHAFIEFLRARISEPPYWEGAQRPS